MQGVHCITGSIYVKRPHFSFSCHLFFTIFSIYFLFILFLIANLLLSDFFDSLSASKCFGWPSRHILQWIRSSATMCTALVLIGMVSTKFVISHLASERYLKLSNPFGINVMSTSFSWKIINRYPKVKGSI